MSPGTSHTDRLDYPRAESLRAPNSASQNVIDTRTPASPQRPAAGRGRADCVCAAAGLVSAKDAGRRRHGDLAGLGPVSAVWIEGKIAGAHRFRGTTSTWPRQAAFPAKPHAANNGCTHSGGQTRTTAGYIDLPDDGSWKLRRAARLRHRANIRYVTKCSPACSGYC